MASTSFEEIRAAKGRPVFAAGGERIGDVDEIYYDYETHTPAFIGIGTGFIATRRVLVPAQGATVAADGVHVQYPRSLVETAPDLGEGHITDEQGAALYEHYGLEPPDDAAGLSDPATETTAMPVVEAEEAPAVTRAEEELRVSKAPVEAGRVRLRKWVETEPVELDVRLRRETAHVRREPVNEPAEGIELADQEIEVRLSAEQPVVEKVTVAKERIVLEKGVETETRTIQDELRKERVDVSHDGLDEVAP